MKIFTAADIAKDRADFRLMGADRFVPVAVAEQMLALLEVAEVAIRTQHELPSYWKPTVAELKGALNEQG